MNWPLLALLAFAASRVVHLIADDIFPIPDRFRDWLKARLPYVEHGLSCTFCLSVWAGAGAAGLAVWQGWAPEGFWFFLVLWWAYAQAIVIIESVVEAL